MSQDTFNKIITSVVLAFFMAMYVISFFTGRTLDWNQLLTFIVPAVIHVVNLLTGSQLQQTTLKTEAAKEVIKSPYVNGSGQMAAQKMVDKAL